MRNMFIIINLFLLIHIRIFATEISNDLKNIYYPNNLIPLMENFQQNNNPLVNKINSNYLLPNPETQFNSTFYAIYNDIFKNQTDELAIKLKKVTKLLKHFFDRKFWNVKAPFNVLKLSKQSAIIKTYTFNLSKLTESSSSDNTIRYSRIIIRAYNYLMDNPNEIFQDNTQQETILLFKAYIKALIATKKKESYKKLVYFLIFNPLGRSDLRCYFFDDLLNKVCVDCSSFLIKENRIYESASLLSCIVINPLPSLTYDEKNDLAFTYYNALLTLKKNGSLLNDFPLLPDKYFDFICKKVEDCDTSLFNLSKSDLNILPFKVPNIFETQINNAIHICEHIMTNFQYIRNALYILIQKENYKNFQNEAQLILSNIQRFFDPSENFMRQHTTTYKQVIIDTYKTLIRFLNIRRALPQHPIEKLIYKGKNDAFLQEVFLISYPDYMKKYSNSVIKIIMGKQSDIENNFIYRPYTEDIPASMFPLIQKKEINNNINNSNNVTSLSNDLRFGGIKSENSFPIIVRPIPINLATIIPYDCDD